MRKAIISIIVILVVVLSLSTCVFASYSTTGYSTAYQGSTLCKSSYIYAGNYPTMYLPYNSVSTSQGYTRLKTAGGTVLNSGGIVELSTTYEFLVRSGWSTYSGSTSYAADFHSRSVLYFVVPEYHSWKLEKKW